MQFRVADHEVKLKGIQGRAIHLASKKQISKLTTAAGKGVFTMLLSEQPFLSSDAMPFSPKLDETQRRELYNLLDQFAVLFSTPTELPLNRSHDHQISLKDES